MFKPSPLLVAASVFTLGVGATQTTQASDEVALNFDLPPVTPGSTPPADPTPDVAAVATPLGDQTPEAFAPGDLQHLATVAPLPIPPGAGNPPRSSSSLEPPSSVYGGLDVLAISTLDLPQDVGTILPPPPPTTHQVAIAQSPAPKPQPVAVGISFDLGESPVLLARKNQPQPLAATPPSTPPTDKAVVVNDQVADQLFSGGADSLVARAVGSAEGTRTPAGAKTSAYFGHVDPGNGVWNLGSFSYQHGANSPDEADARQLQRLRAQTRLLLQKAQEHGIALSVEEALNGIDLANQAPTAALGRGNYIDWLAQARQQGMQGAEAITWARTRAFLDPDTQRWNAPGLGNNVHSISRDQERRMLAIAKALSVAEEEAGSPENRDPLPTGIATNPQPTPIPLAPDHPTAEAVDVIFSLALEDVAPAQSPTEPPPSSDIAQQPMVNPTPIPLDPVPTASTTEPVPEALPTPTPTPETSLIPGLKPSASEAPQPQPNPLPTTAAIQPPTPGLAFPDLDATHESTPSTQTALDPASVPMAIPVPPSAADPVDQMLLLDAPLESH